MNKYCFEIYEFDEVRGNLFKGYKSVLAEDTEQAYLSASHSLPENYSLSQIYIPQEE